MTIEPRHLSALGLLVFTTYGFVPMLTGHPVSYYFKLACTAWEAFDRGVYRSLLPVYRLIRHNVREEWAKLRPLAMEVER